jgi:hypothetical protein
MDWALQQEGEDAQSLATGDVYDCSITGRSAANAGKPDII